jgi:hypothetical protein
LEEKEGACARCFYLVVELAIVAYDAEHMVSAVCVQKVHGHYLLRPNAQTPLTPPLNETFSREREAPST